MGHLYNLKRMALWCIILLTLSEFSFRVESQIPKGFVSINCGAASNTNFVDSFTGLTFVSDDQYTDTGINYKISNKITLNSAYQYLATLRSFPNFTKNCYTLTPVTQGNKYLVRATFMYGNYDGLNKLPSFDMYLGVNYLRTVLLDRPDYFYAYEIITAAADDFIEVCLVNTGFGTPFISALELRPLDNKMYATANSTQDLILSFRKNLGSSDNVLVRYPDDPYDRQWFNFTNQFMTEISTTSTITADIDFETPSTVLQTAVIPSNNTNSIDLTWTSTNNSILFYVVLHFSEIESLTSKDLREFDIYATGYKVFKAPTVPKPLVSNWVSYTQSQGTSYNVSLQSTARSTLLPILGGIEVYTINPIVLLPSESQDVIAINAIKANYSVNKGWNGDPCVPTGSWTGVSCTLTSNFPRITGLNLTSSGLTSTIVSAFGDLTSLKSLVLSNNNLSGPIPSSLDQLTSLTFLDLSGNTNLSTTLPSGLQKRKDNGQLTLKTTDASNNCEGNGCGGKKKSPIIIIVIVVIVVLLLAIGGTVLLVLLCKKKGPNKIAINSQHNVHHGTTPLNGHPSNYAYSTSPNIHDSSNNYGKDSNGIIHNNQENKLNFESQQFTFHELQMITNNFQSNIGTGGFGSVFLGTLQNGKQVAVKLRSEKSSQGFNEFLAEAKNLTRVHHRCLVSLIGYCMEGEYMALVYEYMPEGTLQDKLRENARPLTWKQRLRIAHESAQGLEYLHKSCNPPLVHRDVKTNNILLTANFEAKIADFGLVRAFDGDGTNSHVSTRIVGTPGYLDPDYYTTSQLSEKSDVYSFGVVLLEMVTGQPPIITGPQGGHLALMVRQKLSKGNIESIIDPRMGNQFDINSVWKVAELGLKCTDQATKRPTMTGVVSDLKESLDLEMNSTGNYSAVSGSTSQYNFPRNENNNMVSDVSNDSGFEMGYMGHVTDAPGPAAR